MKQRRLHSKPRMGRDAERMIWLAQGLAEAGSRAEDAYWEGELANLIDKVLEEGKETVFSQAMDRLVESNARAYDELADLIESRSESAVMTTEQGPVRLLLLAMPILAWSRFVIPVRGITGDVLAPLRAHLAAHVLADGARLALADFLFSPDQLPKGYVETNRLAHRYFQYALQGKDITVATDSLPESGQYISDIRYLLGAVAVPKGHPVFRWNEPDGNRTESLEQWRKQGGVNLQTLLPGCALEVVLPDAYFAAWRRADRESRPFSLVAAVAYLHTVLEVSPEVLWAAAAPFYDQSLREWRIGFGRKGEDEVLYGVVWPLLGVEDESADIAAEIKQILTLSGLGETVVLELRMPMEYCEDCGAPLFPNLDGEPTHAGMPESDDDLPPAQLH